MIYKHGRFVSSYSQIDKYLQCPLSWALKYVEKNTTDERSKHLEYGLAVHETLEEFFKSKKEGKLLSLEEMMDIYNMMFDLHRIPFDTYLELDEAYHEGEVMVYRLYEPITELEKLMVGEVKILGVEMPLDLEIPFPEFEYLICEIGGWKFKTKINKVYIIGFIDLVIETDDGIIVIDHKSGKSLFAKDKLETNLQFPIYAMAIEKEYGVLPARNFYNFTKLHKSQEVKVDRERVKESVKEIVKVFKKMNKQKHTAKPTFLCYWCDWSKYKENICKYSSDFKPKDKK